MPQKKTNKGAKNSKRRKAGGSSDPSSDLLGELLFRQEGQQYAHVVRMLGAGRLEAFCYDGTTRLCHIRGNMRKKVWIATGDTILVSVRDFQDSKADVIHRYNTEEARRLQSMGELPRPARINETQVDIAQSEENKNDTCTFEFSEI